MSLIRFGGIAALLALAAAVLGAADSAVAIGGRVYDVTQHGAAADGSADCSAVVQRLLDRTATDSPAVLHFPPGTYRFDRRVTLAPRAEGELRITIRGDGVGVTRLLSHNTEGVFQITLPRHPNNVALRDLSFVTEQPNAGTAFEIRGIPGGNMHSREFTADNVEILTLDARVGYFNYGLVVTNVWRPLFRNCTFAGPWGRGVTSDYSDASPLWRAEAAFVVDDSYAPVFHDCYAWSAKVGYRFRTERNPGPEDGAWFRSYAVETLIGIDYASPSLRAGEPSLWIRDSHFNCRDVGLRISGKRFLYISGCLFYNVDGQAGIPEKLRQASKANPRPYTDVELTGVQWASIRDCVFHFPSNPKRIGVLLNQCARIQIVDNSINIRGVGIVEVGDNPQLKVENNVVSEFDGAFTLRQQRTKP